MQFKESVLTIKASHIKFIRPDVATAHVEWAMRGDKDPDGTPRQPRQGIFTWVLEKRNGKWLIIAAHNTNLGARAWQVGRFDKARLTRQVRHKLAIKAISPDWLTRRWSCGVLTAPVLRPP
jgi:hypothetical protein